KVWLDLHYLIYSGWDDSNFSPNKKPNVDHADHDFDDICAVVQVIPPAGSVETQGKVKYFPTPKMGNLITKCSESDFEFAVPPSTATMIRIVTRAGYRNAVEIVAQDSNEVIWRLENSPGAKDSNSQAATVYCIENRS